MEVSIISLSSLSSVSLLSVVHYCLLKEDFRVTFLQLFNIEMRNIPHWNTSLLPLFILFSDFLCEYLLQIHYLLLSCMVFCMNIN